MEDPWKILEIPRGSSEEEIKRAYKKLSLRRHPDRPGGSTEKFLQLQKAYETLSKNEPETKGLDIYEKVAEFFTVFVVASRYDIFLTLDELYNKVAKEIILEKSSVCILCMGEGKRAPSYLCSTCFGFCKFMAQDCHECLGEGVVRQKETVCEVCFGEGKITTTQTIKVEAFPELQDGDIRVAGRNATARIHVKEHELYKRKGDYDLEIFVDVEKGKSQKYEFEFLDGSTLKFFISEKQSTRNKRYKLSGSGMPKENSFGDLYVHVRVI